MWKNLIFESYLLNLLTKFCKPYKEAMMWNKKDNILEFIVQKPFIIFHDIPDSTFKDYIQKNYVPHFSPRKWRRGSWTHRLHGNTECPAMHGAIFSEINLETGWFTPTHLLLQMHLVTDLQTTILEIFLNIFCFNYFFLIFCHFVY